MSKAASLGRQSTHNDPHRSSLEPSSDPHRSDGSSGPHGQTAKARPKSSQTPAPGNRVSDNVADHSSPPRQPTPDETAHREAGAKRLKSCQEGSVHESSSAHVVSEQVVLEANPNVASAGSKMLV